MRSMARNSDGTVVVKTPGKVASTPVGSGTGKVTPVGAKSNTASPKIVGVKKTPVSKTAR